MDIKNFAKENKHLFWYIKDPAELSRESIVEHVLNYGNFKDFKDLVGILGLSGVAGIFRSQLNNKRSNYRPEIKNYFTLYFNKYVPGNIER